MFRGESEVKLVDFEDRYLEVMRYWLQKEHVKTWYQEPDAWMIEIENRKAHFSFITHFIACVEATPIGFCQYYLCADADEDDYRMFPKAGTYSIDYLIGEEAYLGRGYGKKIILTLIETIFHLPHAQLIVVKPDADNIKSCHALVGAGFSYDKMNGVFILSKSEYIELKEKHNL